MNGARLFLIVLVLAALLGAGIYPLMTRRSSAERNPPPRDPAVVQVVRGVPAESVRTIRLSGVLKSGAEANLAFGQGGRIAEVRVREGDTVRAGALLISLDSTLVRSQVSLAEAGERASRAALDKAENGVRIRKADARRRVADARRGVELAGLQLKKVEEGGRLEERTAEAEVRRAQAAVDAARSALEKARKGPRPEEKRLAESHLAGAERAAGVARKNLEELEKLYAGGGVPRVEVDQAREAYARARDAADQAKIRLDLLTAGASPEDLAAAEAQVRSAQAAHTAAVQAASRQEIRSADLAAARAGVRQAEDALKGALAAQAEVGIAESDVEAARAGVAEARTRVQQARALLAEVDLRSPLSGVVSGVKVHPGETAMPGQPVVTVVATRGVYAEAAAPGRVLEQLRAGQSAVVTISAFPGRRFDARIISVGDVAGPDGRSFPVSLSLSGTGTDLKPGSFARVEVRAGGSQPAWSLPAGVMRSEGGAPRLWVVRGGRIVEIPAEVVSEKAERVVIQGDLQPGDEVVSSAGPEIAPGDPVRTSGAP